MKIAGFSLLSSALFCTADHSGRQRFCKMSFLQFLLNENDISDAQLVQDVEEIEGENFISDITDLQLVRAVEEVETMTVSCSQNLTVLKSSDDEISDSQCMCSTIPAEEEHFDQLGISNSQLLADVTSIESQYARSSVPLGTYQGPSVPIPTLKNNCVVLPSTSRESCKPNFDLGFQLDSNSDDEFSSMQFKVLSGVPLKKKSSVQKSKPTRMFKEPRSEEEMTRMGQKQFASENYKKIHWVVNMFDTWRQACNCNPDAVQIHVDLHRPETINKKMFSYALCRFSTEIEKINGDKYPPKTIYKMVVCLQMHLETLGIFWKLLDDYDSFFVQLCYTCDNLMKEKATGGLGSHIKQAEVLSYDDESFLWSNR